MTIKDTVRSSLNHYVSAAKIALNDVLEKELNTPFYIPLKEFLDSGKKVRPALLLIVHDACGGRGEPGPAAAAIELLHTASLIHDDMIDKSAQRRGESPFHMKYGFEMSLLVADFILSLILDIASGYEDRKVGEILSRTSKLMSVGEMREVQALERGGELSLNDYLEILKFKTAVLFEAATSLGAIIAGRLDIAEDLGFYGLYMGMAYQIKDDLLDWGSPGELTSLLKEADLKELLEEMAINLAKESVDKLRVLEDSPQKDLLRDLALYSVNRKE